MQKIATLFVCCFIAFQIHAEPELRGSPYELEHFLSGVPKNVTITGEAEIKLSADRAVVMLKIITDNKSLQDALRINQELRTKLLGYLKNKNLPLERVMASKFSSTPKYGWFSDKAKSYRVENFVKITVQDENEFQAVAGAVDTWSEIQYLSIDFEHSNKEALKSQVIAKACDNAIERRKTYEEKFAVQLVARRFTEGQVEQKTPAFHMDGIVAEKSTFLSRGSAAPASTPAQIQEGVSPFGELTYSVKVTVEYSVEPK
jgi:uncharacterized protein